MLIDRCCPMQLLLVVVIGWCQEMTDGTRQARMRWPESPSVLDWWLWIEKKKNTLECESYRCVQASGDFENKRTQLKLSLGDALPWNSFVRLLTSKKFPEMHESWFFMFSRLFSLKGKFTLDNSINQQRTVFKDVKRWNKAQKPECLTFHRFLSLNEAK